jgi:hypothetical protein
MTQLPCKSEPKWEVRSQGSFRSQELHLPAAGEFEASKGQGGLDSAKNNHVQGMRQEKREGGERERERQGICMGETRF